MHNYEEGPLYTCGGYNYGEDRYNTVRYRTPTLL